MELIRNALALYVRGFSQIKDQLDPIAAEVRLALLSQSLNSLKLSIDAACQGFYIQSLELHRSVYENWLAFWYLAEIPDQAPRWLDSSHRNPPPGVEMIREKIIHPSKEMKDKVREDYVILSRYAHTDPAGVLSKIKIIDGNRTVLVGVEFDQKKFSACVYGIIILIGNMLDAVDSTIPQNNTWHRENKGISQLLLRYIEKYNSLHQDPDFENL